MDYPPCPTLPLACCLRTRHSPRSQPCQTSTCPSRQPSSLPLIPFEAQGSEEGPYRVALLGEAHLEPVQQDLQRHLELVSAAVLTEHGPQTGDRGPTGEVE